MPKSIWVSATAKAGGNGTVSSPFSSIQDAIDAADPGTDIKVQAGNYSENLRFRDSGTGSDPIRLISVDGKGAAVLRPARDADDTINIDGADHISISGFEIHGGGNDKKQAVHIHIGKNYTDPASHITLEDNTIFRGAGDGIKGSKAEHITLTGNKVIGGGGKEAAIDFVGVKHATISNNEVIDSGHIGLMLKGGSSDIKVIDNLISGTGSSGIEVGGYSTLTSYWPGFLDDGNTYEIRNVTVTGNTITGSQSTALRLIGAQGVEVSGNVLSNSRNLVTIDDSGKFHDTWYSKDISIDGNQFDQKDWLNDRGTGDKPAVGTQVEFGSEPASSPAGTKAETPVADPAPAPAAVAETAPASAESATQERSGSSSAASTPASPEPTAPAQPDDVTRLSGSGNRDLKGGGGNDAFEGNSGKNLLLGHGGDDHLSGAGGNDLLRGGSGNDAMFGGDDNDRLYGGSGDDFAYGDAGRDLLKGHGGGDKMFGGAGDDRLYGGGGDDILSGGDGNDALWGDGGDDEFVFTGGRDVIHDFEDDKDLIVIQTELTLAQVMDQGRIVGGDAVFDLGGDRLTVLDVDDLQTLQNDLAIA